MHKEQIDNKKTEFLHCRMSRKLTEDLNRFCEDTSLTRTAAVERALRKYLESYKETGRI